MQGNEEDGDFYSSGSDNDDEDLDNEDAQEEDLEKNKTESEYNLDMNKLIAETKPQSSSKSIKKENRKSRKLLKTAEKSRSKSYRELAQREARRSKMEKTLALLEVAKNMSSKGAKRKVSDGGGGEAPVFKWRRKRAK